jgi:hypothetical protein
MRDKRNETIKKVRKIKSNTEWLFFSIGTALSAGDIDGGLFLSNCFRKLKYKWLIRRRRKFKYGNTSYPST